MSNAMQLSSIYYIEYVCSWGTYYRVYLGISRAVYLYVGALLCVGYLWIPLLLSRISFAYLLLIFGIMK